MAARTDKHSSLVESVLTMREEGEGRREDRGERKEEGEGKGGGRVFVALFL